MKASDFIFKEVFLVIIVSLSMLLIPLTITASSIINLSIINEYDISYINSQWFINFFMIFYGAFLAITGSLSDFIGRKKIYLGGVIFFALGSFLCWGAKTYEFLLFSRAISGIGAAALTTSSTSIIAANIREKSKSIAFSFFGIFLGVGMVSGPLIATHSNELFGSYKYLFLFTGFFLVILFCISLNINDSFNRGKNKFDLIGSIFLTLFLLSAVTLFSMITSTAYKLDLILCCFVICLLTITTFIYVEMKVDNPILNIDLFRNKAFLSMCLTSLALGLGYISLLFYIPYILHDIIKLDDSTVGMLITVATLPSLFIPPIVTKYRNNLSTEILLKLTLFLLTLSPLLLMIMIKVDSIILSYIIMFLFGASFGISLSYIDGEAVVSVDNNKSGIAAGTFNTFRIAGESISIPFFTALVSTISKFSLDDSIVVSKLSIIDSLIIIFIMLVFVSLFITKLYKQNKGEFKKYVLS
ncbi:MFS transporter [Vibrio gazogenes]|uniref:Major Facilitator Superfamily protein n=1 Tax=Vibrio gazogenes DSM 21264 = NBRC 103151 TaxID=1123492 RepID=A0A1M5CKQ3_VIBGA|nr:MFS transporter [Vibrio gazogenes]USP14222.1 MFS transporter [Vibrio gazogenes]SHF55187.1 Major Facilitator Superfamily protein [Vibrio gazogenes DSM 21264] [Vibrio gazogenes DSM 21264 = NBRC 103151]SJN53725.1 Multidrug resistance protein stp [Vibrio gazogenes]